MLGEQFISISRTLEPFRHWWSEEVIEQYPDCFAHYPQDWIAALAELNDEQLFAFERHQDFSLVRSRSLREYCEQFKTLGAIPHVPASHSCNLPQLMLNRINGKKRHEIQILLSTVERLSACMPLSRVVDFGGGVGNFARLLAKRYRIPTLSIDYNQKLQETGRHRYRSYCPPYAAPLEFHHADIAKMESLPAPRPQLAVGLHTCGPLANAQLRLCMAAEVPAILNFSCCYNKLKESEYYLSELGRAHGLRIGGVARVLASHTPRSKRQDHDQWKRVKLFRYLIHLFLYHRLGVTTFRPLGSCPAALYRGSFREYARVNLARQGIEQTKALEIEYEQFFGEKKWHTLAWQMIFANSIRSLAGRPLELLLLLDRSLYLEESGYIVHLEQYFDRSISPRNVGILALDEKMLQKKFQ